MISSVKERVDSRFKSLSPLRMLTHMYAKRKDNRSHRKSLNQSPDFRNIKLSNNRTIIKSRRSRLRDATRNSILALTQIYGTRSSKCPESYQRL